VTAAVPASVQPLVAAGSHESMTVALGDDEEGLVRLSAVETILAASERATAVGVGPGLGTGSDVGEVVRRLVRQSSKPLVLDADGLNAFAGRATELEERAAPTVLTPHPGELARLLSTTTAAIGEDRLAAAVEAARATGAVVLLKGHPTLIASPDGAVAVNPTGNAGMASGGSGDVLTGIVAAFLAQGMSAFDAACAGAFVHGTAGDLAAGSRGPEAIPAGELAEALPDALASVRHAGQP
jgi:ADP-dependent NAD(P)H-hydrate dehydratase / NAD(P)H-hydrate epimerase